MSVISPISLQHRRAPFVTRQGDAAAPPSLPTAWVQGFVLFELLCQIALLLPGIGPFRMVLRCAAFGASLAMLIVLGGRSKGHPARVAALCVMGILLVSVLHPTGNTLLAGLAQVGMYAAILAPLFWVPRAGLSALLFRRVILTFWAFHALSAGFGVLQVYLPGKLEPTLSPVIAARGQDYVDSLRITLPNGASVFRPMGLTDQPGGAASAGLYTVLFGLGLFLTERSLLLLLASMASMAVGMFVLYLSQVRSVLAMTGICVLALCVLLGLRGDFVRMTRAVLLVAALVVISFLWAVSRGGDVVTKRLATLIDEPAGKVYYSNRGHFLEETINEFLPQYPFGAGLGRWGMMNQYFGDAGNERSGTIWVEIQWTGWLLDGGVPLVLAYVSALVLAFGTAWKVSKARDANNLGLWGALLFAYNLAAFAVTFNYPLFIGQGGLEFWLLNAGLFAAWRYELDIAQSQPAAPSMTVIKRIGHTIIQRPALMAPPAPTIAEGVER